MGSETITYEELWEYVDGSLGRQRRAQIAKLLADDPDLAASAEAMRRENELLATIGDEILSEPIPDHLRAVLADPVAAKLAERSQTPHVAVMSGQGKAMVGLALAASIMIGFGFGWLLRGDGEITVTQLDRALRQVSHVNQFYASQQNFPYDFPSDRRSELDVWVQQVFGRPVPPPDLSTLGFGFQGARILPGDAGKFGYYEFRSEAGARVSVVFWSTDEPPQTMAPLRDADAMPTRYWVRPGIAFAVSFDPNEPQADDIANRVNEFYARMLDK